MGSQNPGLGAALEAAGPDLWRAGRLACRLTGGTFGGLAIRRRDEEWLVGPESFVRAPEGVSLVQLSVAGPPRCVDAEEASALGGHPWSLEGLDAEWLMVHPFHVVPGSEAVLVAAGRGRRPAVDSLDDMAILSSRSLRRLLEKYVREEYTERYNLLARATSDVIWDLDIKTGEVHWNENLQAIFGYRLDEVDPTAEWWEDRLHPDDLTRIRAGFQALFETDLDTWTDEYRFRRADGSYALVLDRSYIARDEGGRPVRLIGSMVDMTERRRAAEEREELIRELDRERSALATLIEQLPLGLAVAELPSREIVIANPGMEQLLGAGPEKFPSVSETIFAAQFERVLDGKTVANEEMVVRREDREVSLNVNASPVRDQEGRIIGAILIASDVTEKQHTLARIRESEARHRLLFQENPVPMTVYDGSTLRYMAVNRSALEMYGYTEEEFLKLTVPEAVPAELREATRKRLLEAPREGARSGEWIHQHKDGTKLVLRGWSHPLVLEGPHARLAVAVDITEQRGLEEKLHQSQKMEAIGQLAGGIAHDFNNLLTVINGYAALTMQLLGDESPLVQNLEAIEAAGERAARLTQQLLAFSRRQVLRPTTLNLNDVLLSLQPMLRRLLREDVELTLILDPQLRLVRADATQLEQVAMNLAINARDAMETGGRLTIETSNIDLDESYAESHAEVTPGEYVLLAVSDNGCGMDSATQRRIFEPFFTTKTKRGGTGLGLPTVYGIVKQSGGHISVYSERGTGTAFRIYLPVSTAPGDSLQTRAGSPRPVHRGSETVLLVEDDSGVRRFSTMVLSDLGYAVIAAENGREALDLAAKFKGDIHLLLTDVVLPRMSGRDLARALAPLRPTMKSLYVSGYTENAIVHHGVLDPGIDYLPKPFAAESLARKVREVLDKPARARGILVADPDAEFRVKVIRHLPANGYAVHEASDSRDAEQRCAGVPVDLVLSRATEGFREVFPHASISEIPRSLAGLPMLVRSLIG